MGRIGDIVELKAQAWLLEQGYEVFRNVSAKGPADLIYLHEGVFVAVDVKKVTDAKRNIQKIFNPSKNERQIELDVQFLYYDEVSDNFFWSIDDIRKSRNTEKKVRVIESFTVKANTFPSLTAAARHYGVNPCTLREYMKRYPNTTSDEAIKHLSSAPKKNGTFSNGIVYTSKRNACEIANVSIGTFEYWHYDVGLEFEEAINKAKKDISD